MQTTRHGVKIPARPTVRDFCQKLLWGLLRAGTHRIPNEDLVKTAVFFSPHPDDETLGCGGTIIRKKKAGADVKIVFMTDGSSSHRRFISEQELKRMRAQEALSACRVLGVEKRDVIFLEFKDQHLTALKKEAIQEVTKILSRHPFDEIFVPYMGDNTPDHSATNAIVITAARAMRRKVVVYEYPVWFWHHWPWTSLPFSSRRDLLRQIKGSFLSWLTLLKNFRWSVSVTEVVELKRLALNEHRSQVMRLVPNSRWPILNDVSNGEFLRCFFQDAEIFRRRQLF